MTSTATDVTAFEMLAIVHPQHAERIAAHNATLREGAIATVEIKREGAYMLTDLGSGYTGIHDGDHVAVTSYTQYRDRESRSVQRLGADAAHLSINDAHLLTAVPVAEWTREEAIAAQRAAEKAATEAMEKALTAATGWGRYGRVAEDGQERAMAALQTAHDLRHYAFSCGVYAKALDPLDRGYWIGRVEAARKR